MFERFTYEAKRIFELGNEEAQLFNHKYLGTEHVLLGIVKHGLCKAAKVLKIFDIDLRIVRLEVEKLVKKGPDMITMGKLPQTTRLKKVIEYAVEEARALNLKYIDTEHILLGLMREKEGTASEVIWNMGLTADKIKEAVSFIIKPVKPEVMYKPVKTPEEKAKKVEEYLKFKDVILTHNEFKYIVKIKHKDGSYFKLNYAYMEEIENYICVFTEHTVVEKFHKNDLEKWSAELMWKE